MQALSGWSLYFLSEQRTAVAPLSSASSTNLLPSKFGPSIAINSEPFSIDLVSVEIALNSILSSKGISKYFLKSLEQDMNWPSYFIIFPPQPFDR